MDHFRNKAIKYTTVTNICNDKYYDVVNNIKQKSSVTNQEVFSSIYSIPDVYFSIDKLFEKNEELIGKYFYSPISKNKCDTNVIPFKVKDVGVFLYKLYRPGIYWNVLLQNKDFSKEDLTNILKIDNKVYYND